MDAQKKNSYHRAIADSAEERERERKKIMSGDTGFHIPQDTRPQDTRATLKPNAAVCKAAERKETDLLLMV
jgi:hypothetical protein